MTKELFNYDAEVAVLAIVLNSPDYIFDIHTVKPYMFSAEPNQCIFQTMEDLSSQKLVPDAHMLESYLQAGGQLERAGGAEYLAHLQSQKYDSSNLKEYEKIVVNSYKARQLVGVVSKVRGMLEDTSDVDYVIGQFRQGLDSLETVSGGESTVAIGDVLSSSWDDILYRTSTPGIRGSTTGFSDLDLATTGINPGDLWFIGARPSMGKTAFVLNMILSGAKVGVKSLVFSLEMGKGPLVERLLAIETGIPLINIRMGNLVEADLEKIANAIKLFKHLPIYLDTNFFANVDYIETTTRKYKKLYDIDIAYMDYIQLLVERGDGATHELGRVSRRLKLLANELSIGEVVTSQLSRGVEMRDDKRPMMSDLRQSGNLEEDTDVMGGLYRDEVYNPNTDDIGKLEFIIRKQRNGPIGTIVLGFSPVTNKVTNLTPRKIGAK